MKRAVTTAQLAASHANMAIVHADRARLRREGMAAAVAFREGRRCREAVADPFQPGATRTCGALGWQPCAHRPNGIMA